MNCVLILSISLPRFVNLGVFVERDQEPIFALDFPAEACLIRSDLVRAPQRLLRKTLDLVRESLNKRLVRREPTGLRALAFWANAGETRIRGSAQLLLQVLDTTSRDL